MDPFSTLLNKRKYNDVVDDAMMRISHSRKKNKKKIRNKIKVDNTHLSLNEKIRKCRIK